MKLARFALVMFVSLSPSSVLADAKSEAQKHVERATQFHQEGKFKDALDALMYAYSLHPKPDLLYAIGQVHVKLGDCTQAVHFYERFLASRPAEGPAAAAREAIETCKTNPPPRPPEPEPEPEPQPQPDPEPPPPTPEPPKTVTTTTTRPFYTDVVGDALVGGGVVLGAVGLYMYAGAVSDLEAAEDAPTYDEHADLLEHSKSKRTLSIAFGIGGAALIGVGVVRWITGDRTVTVEQPVAIVPTSEGGMITYGGRF